MSTFRDMEIRRVAKAMVRYGIGTAAVVLMATGAFAQALDQDPLFKELTDPAKALVVETASRYGNDYRNLCKHNTSQLNVEAGESGKALRTKGQVPPPGFYELEAVNFFMKKCRTIR